MDEKFKRNENIVKKIIFYINSIDRKYSNKLKDFPLF